MATTLANYPMLFTVTDPDLRHTASGGKVTDLGGDDIIFKGLDATTCGAAPPCTLDHEIERYVNTTGELVAWVRIPAVNTTGAGSDTVIYMYYGNSTVTSPTENPTGVWDANYVGVWHLEEALAGTGTNNLYGTPLRTATTATTWSRRQGRPDRSPPASSLTMLATKSWWRMTRS